MGFQASIFQRSTLGYLAFSSLVLGSSCVRQLSPPVPASEPLPPAVRIEVGESGQYPIQGAENHRFAFGASRGDYIQAVVTQQGLDVVVRILDPSGEPIRSLSSRESRFGPEVVYVQTRAGGTHQLEVFPASPSAPRGTYALVLEAVRPASEDDLRRIDLDAGWFEPANDMFRFASRGEWDRVLEIYSDWKDIPLEFEARDYKHRDFATATVSLARALWNYDVDRERALSMVRDGVESLRQSQGPDSFLVATTRRVLADMYLGRNQASEAQTLLEAALEGMEAADDTEPAEYALALRSMGQVHRMSGNLSEAIRFTRQSLDMLEEEQASGLSTLLRLEQVVSDTRFELGNTLRLAGNPHLARPLIESGITPVALDGAAPLIAYDRFTVASMLWLDLGEYGRLQEAVDEALRIAESAPVDPARRSHVRMLSAEGHVLAGEYAAATGRYLEAVDEVSSGPTPYTTSSLLGYIAGLAVDQGRYREASATYRAAFDEALADRQAGYEYAIYGNWARLLGDLGMGEAADALGAWTLGTRDGPVPYPDAQDVPDPVESPGLTTRQIPRRSAYPYGRDLRGLWRDLGMADPEAIGRCDGCFVTVLAENGSHAVIRVWTPSGPHARYLLLRPGDDGLRFVDVLDLPFGTRSANTRDVASGDWLSVEAGTGREWPFSHEERWYAMSAASGFEPRSPYPDVWPDRQFDLALRLRDLRLSPWQIRHQGLRNVAALRGALESPDTIHEVVELLERENALIDASISDGRSPFLANGEEFRAYIESIGRLLLETGDLTDPRTLAALARSEYRADSAFSRELADRGGPGLIAPATELIASDIPQKRWNGISLLERLYEHMERHALDPQSAATIKMAIIAACADPQISMQKLALQALGRIGTPEDIPVLTDVVDTTDSDSVRETAGAAVSAIQSRNR